MTTLHLHALHDVQFLFQIPTRQGLLPFGRHGVIGGSHEVGCAGPTSVSRGRRASYTGALGPVAVRIWSTSVDKFCDFVGDHELRRDLI